MRICAFCGEPFHSFIHDYPDCRARMVGEQCGCEIGHHEFVPQEGQEEAEDGEE